eukprot:1536244-Amphidinium_carterae.1
MRHSSNAAVYQKNKNTDDLFSVRIHVAGGPRLMAHLFCNILWSLQAAKQKVTGKEAELDKVAAEIENEVKSGLDCRLVRLFPQPFSTVRPVVRKL